MTDFAKLLLWFPSRLIYACQPYVAGIQMQNQMRALAWHGDDITLRDTLIKHPEGLKLGSRILFNHHCHVNASGGIEIGNDVVIGPGCLFSTVNHCGEVFFGNTERKAIKIGNNVWIGGGVIVNPGAVIGDNVIIASGAVVTGMVEGDSIYGGVPAKKISDLKRPYSSFHEK